MAPHVDREIYLEMAKIAGEHSRTDDMLEICKEFIGEGDVLRSDELEMNSAAYKKAAEERFYVLKKLEDSELDDAVNTYQVRLEGQIQNLYADAVNLMELCLRKQHNDDLYGLINLKKAEILAQAAEFAPERTQVAVVAEAVNAYQVALEFGKKFGSSNVTFLTTSLNFATFVFPRDLARANDIATKAFHNAFKDMKNLRIGGGHPEFTKVTDALRNLTIQCSREDLEQLNKEPKD